MKTIELLEPRQLLSSYYVSTTGSDTNAGTSAHPFATVQHASAVTKPGDVVTIDAGTYHQATVFTNSGTSGHPITYKGSGTVVFDGTGLQTGQLFAGATFITLKGITIDHAANAYGGGAAAVRAGDNWTLNTVTVENSVYVGFGLEGNNILVQNCVTQFNGQEGWESSASQHLTIKSSTTRYNDLAGLVNPAVEGGGGKFAGCSFTTLMSVKAYGNVGPGIWFDWQNTNIVVTGCTVYGNNGTVGGNLNANVPGNWIGAGIAVEISPGPTLISNNLIYGNSGAGIGIWESTNVTVTGNVIGTWDWSIDMRDIPGRGISDQNIAINHNRFVYEPLPAGQWWSQGSIAVEQGAWTNNSGAVKNIVIDYDDYENGGVYFFWENGNGNYTAYADLPTVRTVLGFEAHGTVQAFPPYVFPAIPKIPAPPN